MTSQADNTLVYFVGGLNDPSKGERNGIEIMKKAVEEEVKTSACCELHQYSQTTFLNLNASKNASTIPVFTALSAEDHSQKLHDDIESIVTKKNPKSLIIIAYSSGTAILRHALAKNAGSEWTKKETLKRIIHIGGMTTGWEFNSEVPKLYLWLGPTVRLFSQKWFPWQIYRGSMFITKTRISLNWLKYKKKNQGDPQALHGQQANLIQEDYLLGTKDEFITPADALEIGGPTNDGNPIYLQVNGCTHTTILSNEAKEANKEVATYIADRIGDISKAASSNTGTTPIGSIAGNTNNIIQSHISYLAQVNPDDIDDYLDPLDTDPIRRDNEVEHVIIVLHGIRDNGMWAKRIGSVIKDTWRGTECGKAKPRAIRVVSPTYGYFSLWDFVRPGGRRRAIEWFQNIYANITALYPSAEISFIGHSNGTYLGAHALRCEEIRYKYMILAGSVLRRNFWIDPNAGLKWKDRVKHFFSFRSLDDWIVGLLPGGLEVVPILGPFMNLGGAGAYGFKGIPASTQERSIRGGHSAGIEEDTWKQLANFLLNIPGSKSINGNSGTTDQDILRNCTESQGEEQQKLNIHLPGEDGHLKPITAESGCNLWTINSILKYSLVFRLAGGLLILIAVIACFLPLLVPLWIMTGLSAHYIILEHPMASMLVIVLASAIAFSCLKNI